MKHKHYEMIVAKAANMDLVSFIKFGEEWMLSAPHEAGVIITFDDRYDYFLCLPQHKDACLHWLNGGRIEYRNELTTSGWGGVSSIKETLEEDMEDGESLWSNEVYFMRTDTPIRIKPKKEKRWIIVDPTSDFTFGFLFMQKDEAEEENGGIHQVIEIEVEV